MSSDASFADLVQAAQKRDFVDPEVEGSRAALRLLWARAEAGRREVKTTKGRRADVASALLDPFSPPPGGDALKAWAEGPPADPRLLPPSPPPWPHVGLVLGPVVRSLRRSPTFAGWARCARWALELGHADIAQRWAARVARQVEAREQAAEITHLQAEIRFVQGELATAERLVRRALQLWPAVHAEERAITQLLLARILHSTGRGKAADDYFAAALKTLGLHDGPHRTVAGAQVELAEVRLAQGDLDGAEELLDPAMDALTRRGLAETAAMARLLQVHGQLLQHRGKLSMAHASVQAARRIQNRLWDTELHPAMATTRHLLGSVAQAQGRNDEALRCFEDNRQWLEGLFGDRPHPLRAATSHQLAALKQAAGELAEATLLLRDALDQEETLFGGRENPSTAITEMSLALVLLRQDRADEGLPLLEHSAQVLERELGSQHPHSQHAQQLLAAARRAEDPEAPNIITPFVVSVLSAAGRPVSRERLASLGFRQLLHERAASLLPVLQAADLASPEPGVLGRDPSQLPAPEELRDRLTVPWSELMEPIVEMHRQYLVGFETLFPATRGRIDPRSLGLRPVTDVECIALVDDALAAAVSARKSGDPSALRDELDLWAHAAQIAIRIAPTTVGTALPRLLIQLLPESRGTLLHRWSGDLSADHRARLEG